MATETSRANLATYAPREGSTEPRNPHRTRLAAVQVSIALAAVAAITCAIEVVFPGVFRDTAMTAGNARGTALVMLAVALPTVLISMSLDVRGSVRARVTWFGGLTYVLYNSVFFAFGIHFNSLFLLYAATLSLAAWALWALARETDANAFRSHISARMPARGISAYLTVMQLLFALLWLYDVIPATLANTAPAGLTRTGMITNPVQMMDFAFFIPLTILAGIWLWQRRARGYLLAGIFLVYGVLESISIATDQLFGHVSDPGQSLGAVPLFVALTFTGLIPLSVYLRHVVRPN